MDKAFKVAIVGCGFITQEVHLPALKTVKDVAVVAVCDVNKDVAAKVARQFGIRGIYSDYNEMLSNEELDVVHVCTSINTHAEIAIKAMEAGCHVLMEKPMAPSLSEADAELAVAHRTGKQICVIHQLLFHPMIMKMKNIVASGVLGDITRVEIKQSCPPWDYPPIADPNHWWQKLPGGVYGDTLPHPLYLMREFIGQIEPVEIYASKIGNYKHLPVDDLQVIFKGEKGLGTIISSCNWPSLWEVVIYGSKKIAHADLNNSYMFVYDCRTNNGRGIASLYIKGNISRSWQILLNSVHTGLKMLKKEHRGHFVQIREFYACLRNDRPIPVTGEDDREITRLVELITEKIDNKTKSHG